MRSNTDRLSRRLFVILVTGLHLVLSLSPVIAIGSQEGAGGTPATPAPVTVGFHELPVTAVALFTSGVGYFQHDGTVDGDAEVTLSFDVEDINDLLKSLVLQDFDGGLVEAVTYPSQDPLSRILESFSLSIEDGPSLAQLLGRARGEEVTIGRLTGIVVGIESRPEVVDGVSFSVPVLNLLTADGILQVSLRDIESVRFTSEELQAEIEAALAVIADHRQQDKRLITIRFSGEGSRRVRIGYVREVPVWKSSYRVVLGDAEEAQLQGWAMVENTGELDWVDVSVALATGQPISFEMDLYSPIYVTRPMLRPDYGTTVAPQEYSRATPVPVPSTARSLSAAPSVAEDYGGLGYLDSYLQPVEEEEIDLSQGVQVAAQAERASIYRISHPLTVPRREAALIPIIADTVPAERLAIYDRTVLAANPLSGVRLTNATGMELPPGPATIFSGAAYGGDAQIPAMNVDEERLLSYAVELGTSVIVHSSSEPETITRVIVVDGVLESTVRQQRTTEYVLDRIAQDGLLHLIVHPKNASWTVIGEHQPASETQSAYRFELEVPGASVVTVPIVEEHVRVNRVAMQSISDSQIVFYLSQSVIDAATQRILERVRELRSVVASRQRARQAMEAEIAAIHREQDRIRRNLEVLETDSELYERYVEALTGQEDELARLAEELRQALDAERQAQQALSDYIESL
jgi:hypothetical protein